MFDVQKVEEHCWNKKAFNSRLGRFASKAI